MKARANPAPRPASVFDAGLPANAPRYPAGPDLRDPHHDRLAHGRLLGPQGEPDEVADRQPADVVPQVGVVDPFPPPPPGDVFD